MGYLALDRAWAAGLFEGEGSISKRKYLRLQIQMTDKDVLERFAGIVERNLLGPYGPYQGEKQQHYMVCLEGSKAEEVLEWMYPYFGARRKEKADQCRSSR